MQMNRKIVYTRLSILIISIISIGIGILRNEQATVLKKAIKICLECIGVG